MKQKFYIAIDRSHKGINTEVSWHTNTNTGQKMKLGRSGPLVAGDSKRAAGKDLDEIFGSGYTEMLMSTKESDGVTSKFDTAFNSGDLVATPNTRAPAIKAPLPMAMERLVK